MLLHLVGTYLGTAIRNGRTLHGHRARCGAPIVAADQLAIGSSVAAGPEPHAHCGKCFTERAEQTEVRLPEGSLEGEVYDEQGRPLRKSVEKEDGMSPLRSTINTKTEDYPYGVPIRRQ